MCKAIWELEQEFELLDYDLQGVKIWQYIRMDLVRMLSARTGVLTQPHTIRQSLSDRLGSLPHYLYHAWRYNPMTTTRPIDTLIFDHDRHKQVDGRNIDIYTQYLIDDFEKQGRDYLVLEKPHLRRHAKDKSPRRFYLDALILSGFLRRQFTIVTLSSSEQEQIGQIKRAIDERFEVNFDLQGTFRHHLKRFKVNYRLYTALLEKYQPQRIFLVVSYGQGDLIKAAKDLGIETIELQHGVFSKYHLGYSFPGRTAPLDYFPDKFYIWSEFWRNMTPLPLPDDNVVNFGFAHLQRSIDKYRGVPRDSKQVLVLSQGSIGPRLANRIYQHREQLRRFNLVYKLHPGEYDRWKDYAALKQLVKLPNFTLAKDVDLYQLMAESYYQIGVNSTALFEGIEFDCKTVLVNLPGIEYMEPLLESGKAVMFEEFIKSENSPH